LNGYANQIFAANATGVGYGTFSGVETGRAGAWLWPPHLVMLEAAAETGLFGAMFYAGHDRS
jgi:hypothetical protein